MRFSDIRGNGPHIRALQRSFETGQVTQAYLFAGPRGSGKRTLAAICAQALLCEAEQDKPCGVCGACARVQSGNHPDLIVLKASKASIGVEEVRGLLSELANRPYEGKYRAVILQQADKMTPQAQNALLKTLEEAPEGHVFFLTCDQSELILPTIHSRCRKITLGALPVGEAERCLVEHGMSSDKAYLFACLSGGVVGDAMTMAKDEKFPVLRETVLTMLEKLHSASDIPAAWSQVGNTKEKEEQLAMLRMLQLHVRDMMAIAFGGDPWQRDWRDRLEKLAGYFTKDGLFCMMEAVPRVKRAMKSNVSWQTAMEPFLFVCVEGLK